MNDTSSDDILMLKQRLAEQETLNRALREKLADREREIDHLQAQLDKLRRMNFGSRSEKVSRRIAQMEADLNRLQTESDTLTGRVEACCRLLSPLEEELQSYVLTGGNLHADDIPVQVLLPGNKKTKTGRLWTYVRDDRNAGSALAPAVWFAYSPDRKGIHPQTHLAGFSGVLQADAYAGFNALYRDGRITEASC